MRVTILKKYLPHLIDFFEYMAAEKFSENEKNIVFEICVSFQLTKENLKIKTYREWQEFCKSLSVEGGRKLVFRDRVSLVPRLSKRITVKIPEGQYLMVKKILRKEKYPVSVSSFLRREIEEEMLQHRKMEKTDVAEELVGYG